MYECEGSPDDSKKTNSQRAELHGQHLICPVPIYTRLPLCVSYVFTAAALVSSPNGPMCFTMLTYSHVNIYIQPC